MTRKTFQCNPKKHIFLNFWLNPPKHRSQHLKPPRSESLLWHMPMKEYPTESTALFSHFWWQALGTHKVPCTMLPSTHSTLSPYSPLPSALSYASTLLNVLYKLHNNMLAIVSRAFLQLYHVSFFPVTHQGLSIHCLSRTRPLKSDYSWWHQAWEHLFYDIRWWLIITGAR